MHAIATPKQTLRALETAPPGKRFQRLHKRRQQSAHGGLKNAFFMLGGVIVVAAGVVTYPIPIVPSDIIILIGVAIFAQGSGRGARALDWLECWFRRHFPGAIKLWKRLPPAGKIAVSTAWMVVATGIGFLVYRAFE